MSNKTTGMKKTVLGVVMVVVFCITWWLVASEAWQAIPQAEQARQQAELKYKSEMQKTEQAKQEEGRERKIDQKERKAAHEKLMARLRVEYAKWMSEIQVKQKEYAKEPMPYRQEYEDLFEKQIKEYKLIHSEAVEAHEKNYEHGEQTLADINMNYLRELEQISEQIKQVYSQAEQTYITAEAHFRTQSLWAIGAGLLAIVLLLVGVVAWSKT